MTFRIAPAWRGATGVSAGLLGAFAWAGLSACAAADANPPAFSRWANPAPAFALPALDGAIHGLAAEPAQATLVHFFATWCEPCRDELPALQRFAQRAGQRVRVLAISVAEPDPRVRRFFDAAPVGYPVLLDRDRVVARGWGVASLPSTIALDARLEPRLALESPASWDEIDPASFLRAIENAQPN